MTRLLIVKLSSIGDVLHALPVVKSIKQDLPDLSIGWVVRARCSGLLQGCEFVDSVYVINDKPSLFDLIALRKLLLKAGYDTVFDMQGLLLSGVIAAISGARRRVGLNRNREMNRMFLTEPIVEGLEPLTHAVDVQLGFRTAAGLAPVGELRPLTHLGTSSTDWLSSLGQTDQSAPIVVLNVGASTIYKRWPIPNWIALANSLTAIGVHIVLTAGPAEKDDADEIASGVVQRDLLTNLGGVTTQEQLAAIVTHGDLVVTGDTGPMHLAAAVGTPTVALFGPTDPRLTGPYGPNHKVIWKQLSCSPCFRHPTCEGRVDCLSGILPDEVFSAVTQILAKKHGVLA